MIHRRRPAPALAAALLLLTGGAATADFGPDAGPLKGSGTFTDSEGREGSWRIEADLRDGVFAGSGRIEHLGQAIDAPLAPGGSYLENGRCHLRLEADRARFEIAGPCGDGVIAGRVHAFLPGLGALTGDATGRLALTGGTAPAPVAPAELPTAVLTCAWMERVGGVVAGDPANYELRYSSMVTLGLGEGGRYETAVGGGGFLRKGDKVRLTGGPFAGALGRLGPDRSGDPAVVFELEANRAADGTPLIDPETTRCTRGQD